MFDWLKQFWNAKATDQQIQARLEEIRKHTAVPVFWLFGKTQTGKTSIIKYLTGADEAEIGNGFQPCTRFSRLYQFPTPEAPLLTFLDTRGLDEPGYDAGEDLAEFDPKAHVVVVTVKALDHAQENLLQHLRRIRKSRPSRPVVLALTCLHEAYPQRQHPQPYPFAVNGQSKPSPDEQAPGVPQELQRSLDEQRRRFGGLVDHVVPIDLTRPEEGYAEP